MGSLGKMRLKAAQCGQVLNVVGSLVPLTTSSQALLILGLTLMHFLLYLNNRRCTIECH